MRTSLILRRSLLYVPGDREAMIAKAPGRGADGIILNLEDVVAPANKDAAREMVARALGALNFGGAEIIVRINPVGASGAAGYRDLLAVVPGRPQAILLPKVGSPEEARFVAWTVARLEELHGLPPGGIQIMCMIESAAGLLAAAEIAACHPAVTALVFGANDLSADLGCAPALDGPTLSHAASRLILAAKAAGVAAIDSPHMKLGDSTGLAQTAARARAMGFDGKSAIHPEQVRPINAAFSPTPEQIAWARRVVELIGRDESRLGAALLDGQLIEAPHLAQARRLLAVAERLDRIANYN